MLSRVLKLVPPEYQLSNTLSDARKPNDQSNW
jgi:hypothetical protein